MVVLSRRNAFVGGFASVAAIAGTAHGAVPRGRRLPNQARWAVFYGATAPTAALAEFNVLVLDPLFDGDLAALRRNGTTTLGYLSIGEIAKSHPAFRRLPEPALLVEENPNWPGTFAVDVRRPSWREFVLKDLAEAVRFRGFDGFFLDTLDTPVHLEQRERERFEGMSRAAIETVKALRKAHPAAPIMLNRGYPLLPELTQVADAVLAESLLGTYDHPTKTYRRVAPDDTRRQLELLAPALSASPPMPIYTLDYWNLSDRQGVASLYAEERALHHSPYVSSILLDGVHKEPPLLGGA